MRFVDVGFKELVGNKMSTVAKVYEGMGVELTAEAKESMETFLREQGEARKHQGQPKKYSLAEFGISEEDVLGDPVFAEYSRTYAVVAEGKKKPKAAAGSQQKKRGEL